MVRSVPGIVMLHGLEGNEEELLRLVKKWPNWATIELTDTSAEIYV